MNQVESIYVAEVTIVNPMTREEETVEIYRDAASNTLFGIDANWDYAVGATGTVSEAKQVSVYSPYNREDLITLDPLHIKHETRG